jgi:hypothetical protein
MADERQKRLDIYLQEYGKLKDEQAQKIGFRDNLLYMMLALFGTVLAFVVGDKRIRQILIGCWRCHR